MALTYQAIATVEVGSGGASTIEFSSIPGTYTDLVIKGSARTSTTATVYGYWAISFNNQTTNFSFIRLLGYNAGPDSNGDASNTMYVGSNTDHSGFTANVFSNAELYIPNYAGSNVKPISFDGVVENNSSTSERAFQELNAGIRANTAAITSITITAGSGTFKQYSTATLYGIKNTV